MTCLCITLTLLSALCRFTHTLSCFSTFLLVTTALFTSSFRLLLVYPLILPQEEVEGSEWYVSSKRFREQGQWVGSYGLAYNKSSSSPPPLRLRSLFWCVFCMQIVYTCIVCRLSHFGLTFETNFHYYFYCRFIVVIILTIVFNGLLQKSYILVKNLFKYCL